MNNLLRYLKSLLLASAFSFVAPVVVVGCLLVGLVVLGQVPWVEEVAETGVVHLINFLRVFGSGNAWDGVLVIGTVCGLVGALFDTYAFYQDQRFKV